MISLGLLQPFNVYHFSLLLFIFKYYFALCLQIGSVMFAHVLKAAVYRFAVSHMQRLRFHFCRHVMLQVRRHIVTIGEGH